MFRPIEELIHVYFGHIANNRTLSKARGRI